MGSSHKRWSEETLKEAWNKMFDYSYYQNHYQFVDIQSVIIIMEAGLNHVKQMSTAYSALRASEKELVAKLESKTDECSSMKEQLQRLGKNCDKCEILEMSLVNAKLKAKEAQAQVDSIANILKLGEHPDSNHGAVRSAALDVVSQMILGSSPSPKKRKKINSHEKSNPMSVLAEKTDFDNRSPSPTLLTRVSQSPPLMLSNKVVGSPIIDVKRITTYAPCEKNNQSPCEKNPLSISIRKTNAKKDLLSNFENEAKKVEISLNASKSVNGNKVSAEDNIRKTIKSISDNRLSDEPLKERKKENIKNLSVSWDASTSESLNESTSEQLIEETPGNKKRKADFWIMKEKRGLLEISKNSGRRMKQMKLKLGTKKHEKKIDLSKIGDLAKSDSTSKESDDIVVISSDERPVAAQYFLPEADANTTAFKPLATSTQRLTDDHPGESSKRPIELNTFDRLPAKETIKEPNYVYARDAVRKKADRKKLEGWECKECIRFYSAMGKQMDPAELKKCMNDCSKHRNKFKPKLDDTPQDFWNPLVDSEDDKGYTSIYMDKD